MHTYYQTLNSDGYNALYGVIARGFDIELATWQTVPKYAHPVWVINKGAIAMGYENNAYTAIQCALYANGLSDFSPAVHAPELGVSFEVRP